MPSELGYLWNHYRALSRARTSSGFGPNPIEWSEIAAYNSLTRSQLEPWEAEAIRLMDDFYMIAINTKE